MKIKGTIEVEFEPVLRPASQEEWSAWCEERGFDALAIKSVSRKAWISELSTYLRADDTLIYYEGVLIATGRREELGYDC